MSYAKSVIKSIQYGTVTLTGVTSATATITSVNTAKAVLIFLGLSSDDIYIDRSMTRITLTNATTVTGTKFNSTGNVVVGFVVVEFV